MCQIWGAEVCWDEMIHDRMEELNNQGRSVRFRIVERRGVTLEEKLRRSNPWAGERCGRPTCFPCQTDEGGDCWREGITYSLICEVCGEEVAKYFGESGRNGFTRGEEHLNNKQAADVNKSVLQSTTTTTERMSDFLRR